MEKAGSLLYRVVVASRRNLFASQLHVKHTHSQRMSITPSPPSVNSRGALIVFEGCDRCGKSTQSDLLVTFLKSKNYNVSHMRFPDRTTASGKKIDAYLKQSQDLSGEDIHRLFSENRWEVKNEMKKLLEAGTTIVVDRYSYSGVAYTAAKGIDFEWCCGTEKGLLQPDIVFYLKTAVDALQNRSDFGAERYEKADFQKKVSSLFDKIYQAEKHYWTEIKACDEIATIHKNIADKALKTISEIEDKPIQKLW